jgi:hypothetical protein
MDKVKKFKTIPLNSIVNIQISGAFMVRIQMLLDKYIQLYGKDKFLDFAKHMIDNKSEPRNEDEENLYTIISLLTELEKQADEQGLTEEKEISSESLSQQYPQSE